jgi:adenylate cyclase
MSRWNAERRAYGEPPINYGLALHVGEVLWSNVGTRTRLDFTVVGPAVNVAHRLEQLAKELGRQLVLSEAFAAGCPHSRAHLHPLGRFTLRDIDEPIAVYTVDTATAVAAGATISSTPAAAS